MIGQKKTNMDIIVPTAIKLTGLPRAASAPSLLPSVDTKTIIAPQSITLKKVLNTTSNKLNEETKEANEETKEAKEETKEAKEKTKEAKENTGKKSKKTTKKMYIKCFNCGESKYANLFSKNQKKKKQSKCDLCVSGKNITSLETKDNLDTKPSNLEPASSADIYIAKLSKERVRTTTFDATHTYFALASKEEKRTKENTKKVSKELKKLKKFLPLHENASIFIRFDKFKPFLMRALISGPPDTPYESGLFAFDVYVPPTYPTVPPKVTLITTGQGTVRFSPNLYKEGKVCLSLLGTWQGPGWDPKVSSLLQVFISIQALIFVENPHSMEPGFGGWGEGATKIRSMITNCKAMDTKKNGRVSLEYMITQCKNNDQTDNWRGSDPAGTIKKFILAATDCIHGANKDVSKAKTNEETKTNSPDSLKDIEVDYEFFLNNHFLKIEGKRYNARIHAGCSAWAMYDMMQKPLPEFQNVIEKHFEIKSEYLYKQLSKLVAGDVILPHRQKKLISTFNQIKMHLNLDNMVAAHKSKPVQASTDKVDQKESALQNKTNSKSPNNTSFESLTELEF